MKYYLNSLRRGRYFIKVDENHENIFFGAALLIARTLFLQTSKLEASVMSSAAQDRLYCMFKSYIANKVSIPTKDT